MSQRSNKTPSSKIRLVVTDMDGTLLTPQKTISPRTLEAIAQLRQKNVRVCLVSSRPPGGIEMYFPTLKLHSAYGALNGGTIFSPSGDVIHSLTLHPDVTRKTVTVLGDHHIQAWLFQGHEWIVPSKDDPLVQEEMSELQMTPLIWKDLDKPLEKIAKISGCSLASASLHKAHDTLKASLHNKANVSLSHQTLLDITPPGANKGYALTHLAKYYNVTPSEVAAIGDMDNDIPMLDIAGLSIAMGQATDKVKERAHFVTSSDGQEGWARAMEDYVLPRVG